MMAERHSRFAASDVVGPDLGLCVLDPERWTDHPDAGAVAICRACARRFDCARDAVRTEGAIGLWAGVVIPAESGRARAFALAQLGNLAEFGAQRRSGTG
jgi:WhiB family transcriptional regulator, redox-sensing transcriptional regulator